MNDALKQEFIDQKKLANLLPHFQTQNSPLNKSSLSNKKSLKKIVSDMDLNFPSKLERRKLS